jgi:hypothetical protein
MSQQPTPEKDIENQNIQSASILATAFLKSIFQFFRQTEIHDPTNAVFDVVLQEVIRPMEIMMKMPGQPGIRINFRGEMFFVNGVRMRPKSRSFYIYRYLLRFLKRRRLGGLHILSIPSPENLKAFLWCIAKIQDEVEPHREVLQYLKLQGITDFDLEPLKGGLDKKTEGDGELGDIELIVASLYQRLQKFVEICFDNRERAGSFSLKPVQESLNDLILLAEEDIVQMLRLVSVKRYDRPLPYRAVNACFVMMAWARSLRLPPGVVVELAGAALAHPFALLSGSNSSQEQILKAIEDLKNTWQLSDLQRLVTLEWTKPYGKGGVYEIEGVKCYQHFFSRMVRIVALFEDMTTYQEGRRVYLPDEALAELLKDPESCDPTLMKLFINWIGVYPVGSLVVLQSGEVAQIFAGASDPTRFQRPIVSVLKTASGKLLDRPQLLDLSEMNEKLGVYKRNIKRSITVEEAKIPPNYFQLTPVGV